MGVATNNRIWWYPQDGGVDQSNITSPVRPGNDGYVDQITGVSPGAGNHMALYLDGVQVGPTSNACSGSISGDHRNGDQRGGRRVATRRRKPTR